MDDQHTGSGTLRLTVLPQPLCIARLAPDQDIPAWALQGPFCSVTRSEQELSIVCSPERVPPETVREDGWRALRVEGPLDFALVGIVAALSTTLAAAKVSIFVISTYDTDYLLVRTKDLERATTALATAGHHVSAAPPIPA